MQESKRRSSTVRAIERRSEFIHSLNKMIWESREMVMRESLNPLRNDPRTFRWVNEDVLTFEALSSFLKHAQKEVVVVGALLPYQALKHCAEALIDQQIELLPLVLQAAFLEKSELPNLTILLLLLEEDASSLEAKPDLQEKILFNLATVWITTEQIVKKRVTSWEARQQLFKKNNSLLVVKTSASPLSEELSQRLEGSFWSLKSCESGIFEKRAKVSFNLLSVPSREAYQNLQQQRRQGGQLNEVMLQLVKVSLKRNWKYSRGLLCYPFLYFASCWMKEEQRDTKQLVEISLNWYFKGLEEQFNSFVAGFTLPADELKLRSSLAVYKKTLVMDVRRQLSMFQNLLLVPDLSSKYIENLLGLLSQKEADTYLRNNKMATDYNQGLLLKIYDEQINKQFEQVLPRKGEEAERSDRNIKDFQADFQSLLDNYNNNSIRVRSQLATFNKFITGKKVEYAEMLARELRTSKKKYANESEELKDRLEIQMGVLQTLEEEIKDLEDRKHRVDAQNYQAKQQIEQLRVRRVRENLSDSSARKKFAQAQTKTLRKDPKQFTKKLNHHQNEKKSRCCCQVM